MSTTNIACTTKNATRTTPSIVVVDESSRPVDADSIEALRHEIGTLYGASNVMVVITDEPSNGAMRLAAPERSIIHIGRVYFDDGHADDLERAVARCVRLVTDGRIEARL